MNFKKGETIIYPQHGACIVMGTQKMEAFGDVVLNLAVRAADLATTTSLH